MSRRIAAFLSFFLLLTLPSWAQNQRWEIEPKPDAQIRVGKLSTIGGDTGPGGVRFVIKNLDIMEPIEIVVAADDASKPVTLLVYKDGPEQALLERATDASGTAIAKFRTDESVQLMVKGAEGAKYQLMAWVGPKIEVPTPPAFVPIDERGTPLVEGMTLTPPAPVTDANKMPAQTGATVLEIPKGVEILLGLILVALVVLIVVILRRGKSKAASAAILFALGLLTLQHGNVRAQPVPSDPFAPHTVQPPDAHKQVNDAMQKLRDLLDALDKGGVKTDPEAIKVNRPTGKSDGPAPPPTPFDPKKTAGQYVTSMKLLLDFMEEFGLIDPREAAVQPNYNPPGQPLIPSRCAGTGACGACFNEANAKLDKSRTLLENMYVIYKQTELKTGRIIEMANAAAGLSPYAQLAWSAAKANPNSSMNVAQKNFYDKYDTNLAKLLQMANEGLIGVSACERDNFKDYDWYPRYGMIYYNFLKDRYTRK
jgi:hypothetical protein